MAIDANIWLAAGEGDLARVQHLVAHHAVAPNAPDEFTYTPMHAAASYGQLHVLAYLVAQGGDVNIADEDGDTPLYTVEHVDTARWLVDHGALIDRRNAAGISPIAHLDEDFPEIAAFLRARSDPSVRPSTPSAGPRPSQHAQDAASESLTANLIQSVSDIMRRAEADGVDPDEAALRAAVSRTVLQGVVAGYDLSTHHGADAADPQDARAKRPRMNGSHGTE